jgi:hypothetical protein
MDGKQYEACKIHLQGINSGNLFLPGLPHVMGGLNKSDVIHPDDFGYKIALVNSVEEHLKTNPSPNAFLFDLTTKISASPSDTMKPAVKVQGFVSNKDKEAALKFTFGNENVVKMTKPKSTRPPLTSPPLLVGSSTYNNLVRKIRLMPGLFDQYLQYAQSLHEMREKGIVYLRTPMFLPEDYELEKVELNEKKGYLRMNMLPEHFGGRSIRRTEIDDVCLCEKRAEKESHVLIDSVVVDSIPSERPSDIPEEKDEEGDKGSKGPKAFMIRCVDEEGWCPQWPIQKWKWKEGVEVVPDLIPEVQRISKRSPPNFVRGCVLPGTRIQTLSDQPVGLTPVETQD